MNRRAMSLILSGLLVGSLLTAGGMEASTSPASASGPTTAWSSGTAPTDLALKKPATQSSDLGGQTGAGLAVDGNTDGNFFDQSVSSTGSDVNAWWGVDLGSSQQVRQISVFNRTDCCSTRLNNYWVFVSDSPFDTTLTPTQQAQVSGVWSVHQTGTAGLPTQISVATATGSGRYVMVQLDGTGYLSLAEVEVYGPRSFNVDTANVVAESNLVYNTPNTNPNYMIPLGNGSLGAAAWAANGFTAQLNRDDTFPSRKSLGQVSIPALSTITNAPDFQATLDLYNGQLVETGAGMKAVIYVRADKDEMVVDVTGAPAGTVTATATLNYGGRTPVVAASGAVGTLSDVWKDSAPAGAPRPGDFSNAYFGTLLGLTANGQNVTASTGTNAVSVSFTPNSDGSYRVVLAGPTWAGGPDNQNTASEAQTAAANTFGSDATASSAQLQNAHQSWWHRYWSQVNLTQISSADGVGQYVEATRTLYLYTQASMNRGQYPGSYAAISALFSYNQDTQDWGGSDYWFFNLRMQVAANLSSGAPDLNKSIYNLYVNNLANLQQWTHDKIGGDGTSVCLPETMRFNGNGRYSSADLTNASCSTEFAQNSGASNFNSLTISSGAEVGLWIWRQYQQTGDKALLDAAWPLMKATAQFLYNYGNNINSDGGSHTAPTDQKLHTYANAHEQQWDVYDPTNVINAMLAYFPAVVAAAGVENDTSTLIANLQAAQASIPALPLTDAASHSKTSLTDSDTPVFAYSAQPAAPQRNFENPDLETLWPYETTSDESTAKTISTGSNSYSPFQVAQNTYASRRNPNSADWSADAIQAAHLSDAASMKSAITNIINSFQIYPNGFGTYAPGTSYATPYGELSGVVTTALNDALVQANTGTIKIAPAWPSDWNASGTVSIAGGDRVDVQMASGSPSTVVIEAGSTHTVKVRSPWDGASVEVIDAATNATVVAPTTDTTLTFPVIAGHQYLVEQATAPFTALSFAKVTGTAATVEKHLGVRTLGLAGPNPSIAPATSGLVDWEPTSGSTVPDVSGTHRDATITGTTPSYVSGRNGPAVVVGGSSYLTTPNAIALPSMTAFTAEMLVRVDGSGSYRRLVDSIPVGGNGSTGFLVDLNASNQVRFIGGGLVVQTTATIPTGVFTHVAVTLSSAGQLTVYLDGKSVWSQAQSASRITMIGAMPLRFGADQSGASVLAGAVQQVRLYNYDLGAATIANDGDPLVVDWEPTSGSTVTDQSHNQFNGTVTGGTPSYTTGRTGPAVVLASGSYIKTQNAVTLPSMTAFSAEMLVRVDGSGGTQRLLDDLPVGGDGSTGMAIGLNSSNQLTFVGGGRSVQTTVTVPTGAFTHITLTLTSTGTLTAYIDGEPAWSQTGTATTVASAGSLPLQFGADQSGGSLLTGAVQQVRLYNYALSAATIANDGDPLVVDWEPTTGSTVVDQSHNHYDATIAGTPGYVSGATPPAVVVGGGSYLTRASVTLPAMKSFTAEATVRVDGTGSYRRLIDYIPVGGGGSTGFLIDLNPSNQIRFIGAGQVVQTTASVPTGSFAKVAVTLDYTGLLTVYVNGTATTQQLTAGTVNSPGAINLRFGADQNGANQLTGAVQRVRVYSMARTATQVSADGS